MCSYCSSYDADSDSIVSENLSEPPRTHPKKRSKKKQKKMFYGHALITESYAPPHPVPMHVLTDIEGASLPTDPRIDNYLQRRADIILNMYLTLPEFAAAAFEKWRHGVSRSHFMETASNTGHTDDAIEPSEFDFENREELEQYGDDQKNQERQDDEDEFEEVQHRTIQRKDDVEEAICGQQTVTHESADRDECRNSDVQVVEVEQLSQCSQAVSQSDSEVGVDAHDLLEELYDQAQPRLNNNNNSGNVTGEAAGNLGFSSAISSPCKRADREDDSSSARKFLTAMTTEQTPGSVATADKEHLQKSRASDLYSPITNYQSSESPFEKQAAGRVFC